MSGAAATRFLLTAAQVRQLDANAAACGVPTALLMERAGAAVANAIMARWAPRPVVVVCGGGNNGGDGAVAARHLRAAGWPVTLARVSASGGRGEAQAAYQAWEQSGGATVPLTPDLLATHGLVVDALFGVGLTRAPEGAAAEVLACLAAASHRHAAIPVVAIDLPSGLHADTGAVVGACAVQAALTVTFAAPKRGLWLLPGRHYAGDVHVASIGLPSLAWEGVADLAMQNTPRLWQHALPVRRMEDHKYARGHAWMLGGSVACTGAAKLAAVAALRAGAGAVTLGVPPGALMAYAVAMMSVMVRPVAGAEALAAAVETDARVTALGIGPGHGVAGHGVPGRGVTTERTTSLLRTVLASGRACVLDADALTVLAMHPEMWPCLHARCVLTPHEGEYARLEPEVDRQAVDKITRAVALATRLGAVVALKGADTVIAAPDGRVAVNAHAPSCLATAGTGDVLTGMVLGLLAQGMPPFEAAAAAVWLHGEAAFLAGFGGGGSGDGMIAEDVLQALPRAWASLHSGLKTPLPANGDTTPSCR